MKTFPSFSAQPPAPASNASLAPKKQNPRTAASFRAPESYQHSPQATPCLFWQSSSADTNPASPANFAPNLSKSNRIDVNDRVITMLFSSAQGSFRRVCTYLQERSRCCKLRPTSGPPCLPSTIPLRAIPPSFSRNATRAPPVAHQSAESLPAARRATPMPALPCMLRAEVLPTAQQPSVKGSSSTRRPQTAMAHQG